LASSLATTNRAAGLEATGGSDESIASQIVRSSKRRNPLQKVKQKITAMRGTVQDQKASKLRLQEEEKKICGARELR